jgi:uncharacterized membrane protein
MSLKEKFFRWQEKMRNRNEKEKHAFAVTAAFFVGALACFFIILKWYFLLTGGSFSTSLTTEIENFYTEQKENLNMFFKIKDNK